MELRSSDLMSVHRSSGAGWARIVVALNGWVRPGFVRLEELGRALSGEVMAWSCVE